MSLQTQGLQVLMGYLKILNCKRTSQTIQQQRLDKRWKRQERKYTNQGRNRWVGYLEALLLGRQAYLLRFPAGLHRSQQIRL